MSEPTTTPRLRLPDAALEGARMQLDLARWAAAKLAKTDRASIMRIVDAVADAAHAKARHYGEWAVRETGYGVAAHKTMKNEACSRTLVDLYRDADFVSPRIDHDRRMVALPRPAGVVFALIPVTNPVASVYFQTLLALMTRNAIVLSLHPGAKAVSADAALTLAKAAKAAGAPEGAIQVIAEPDMSLIQTIMSDARIDLIVAAGGPAVVRAAHGSGNPALGVGPGNTPVVVDESADIEAAARRIVASKSFDNSGSCANESTVLAFEQIAAQLLAAIKAEGAHICTPGETDKLRATLFTADGFDTTLIGKDAEIIARKAGFSADGAKILVTPVTLVQPEEKLVGEKLYPVLAFARVAGIDQAMASARSMMRHAGKGHHAAIHSQDERNILVFSAAIPALRVIVNAGCSSMDDSLTPHHFVHYTHIAYHRDSAERFGSFDGHDPLNLPRQAPLFTP